MTEKIYEMLWDCKRCSTKKLLGKTHRHCPNCGGPQDPNDRYFPNDNEKVEVRNHVYYGIDVICSHCNCANSRKNNNCISCGASLKDGDDVDAKLISESPSVLKNPNEDKRSSFFKKYKFIKFIIIIAFIWAGVEAWISLNTKEVSAIIFNYQWNTTIRVEEFKVINSGAWKGAVPSDAYNQSCYSKHHHDNQVVTGSHQECSTSDVDNGDGSFREIESCETVYEYKSVPVYKIYCDFKINRWIFVNNRKISGSRGQELKYNTLPLSETCTGNLLGCKKEAGRSLYFSATIKTLVSVEEEDIAICHIDKQLYDLQPKVVIVKTVFNDIKCDSLSFRPD